MLLVIESLSRQLVGMLQVQKADMPEKREGGCF
jgi:hypothetical protein